MKSPFSIFIGFILCLYFLVGCKRKETYHFPILQFSTELKITSTSVKNQGNWPASWIYATLSMIESERIALHDSINLSATFLERMYCEQLIQEYQMQTKCNPIWKDFSGTPFRCLELAEKYGMLTYASFRPQLVLTWPQMRTYLDSLAQANCAKQNYQIILDTSFAYLPPYISLYGATYTSIDLMRSVLQKNSYEAFSPYSTLSKNKINHFHLLGDSHNISYQSIKQKDIMSTIITTLKRGHSLVWIGDTAIYSYSSRAGLALEPNPEKYSKNLERYEKKIMNSPLHSLHIIGIAHQIKRQFCPIGDGSSVFLIAKDSHGKQGHYKGFIYLSENFIKSHTAAIYRLKPQFWQ